MDGRQRVAMDGRGTTGRWMRTARNRQIRVEVASVAGFFFEWFGIEATLAPPNPLTTPREYMASSKAENADQEELKAVPRGGYRDAIFNNPVKTLRCSVCSLVPKEPHLLSCCGSHVCEVSNVVSTLYLFLCLTT